MNADSARFLTEASPVRAISAILFLIAYFLLRSTAPIFLLVFQLAAILIQAKNLSKNRLILLAIAFLAQSAFLFSNHALLEVLRMYASGLIALALFGSFFRLQDLLLLLRYVKAPRLIAELVEQMTHSGLIIAHSASTSMSAASLRISATAPFSAKAQLFAETLARSAEKAFHRIERAEEAKAIRSARTPDVDPPRSNTALELRNVSNVLGGESVLKGIDLCLANQEWIAVIGPSGSGKTSLLRMLAGLSPASGGLFQKFGDQTHKNKVDARIQLLFQDPLDQIIGPTPKEDLRWSYPWEMRHTKSVEVEINSLLDQLGLSNVKNRSILHLSAGERKRLTLASLVPLRPSVLLLDEPTSGLDDWNARAVNALIEERFKDCAVVFVTHELDRIPKNIKKALLMRNGRIVRAGDRQSMISDYLNQGVDHGE